MGGLTAFGYALGHGLAPTVSQLVYFGLSEEQSPECLPVAFLRSRTKRLKATTDKPSCLSLVVRCKEMTKKSRETNAQRTVQYILQDIVPWTVQQRVGLALPDTHELFFAIKRWREPEFESVVVDFFRAFYSLDDIRKQADEISPGCCITTDDREMLMAIERCLKEGDSDMSVNDYHRPDASLLFIRHIYNRSCKP